MDEVYIVVSTREKHRPRDSSTGTVQERLRQLIDKPVRLEELELSEAERLRFHQGLVRFFAARSNEVPVYAAIREWKCANQRTIHSDRNKV